MQNVKMYWSQFVAFLGKSFWFGLKMWVWLLIGLGFIGGLFLLIFKKKRVNRDFS